jgi:hypothetical protein
MRLRELYDPIVLFENYNGKLNKLKKEFPDQTAEIDARVNWATEVFKGRNQSMLWYISLYESWLKQNSDPSANAGYERLLGGFEPINDFAAFETSLNHWLVGAYAERNQVKDVLLKLTAQSTTVDSLVKNLQAAETAIKKEDEDKVKNATPVDILSGDQVILPLGSQGDWWILPTNKHDAESKFMGHCGTAAHSTNVLLSLRDKIPTPWVTIEYDKDQGLLYQMKGRNNSKPANKFHYAIMALLQSNLVNGIYTGKTYQPSSDFSILDMKPELIKQLISPESFNNPNNQPIGKEKLIFDQIEKYPIDMLRDTAEILRNIPKFRNFAVSKLPGLNLLINADGSVSNDTNTWERAIEHHPGMIIYSPVGLKDWENRVAEYLVKNSSDAGYCGNHIRGNYNIMKRVITDSNPAAIELVPYRVPHYKELALIAVSRKPTLIKSINTEGWSKDEIKQAWKNAATEYLGTEDWPTDLFTPDDEKDIWRTMLKTDKYGYKFSKIPTNLFDENEMIKIWSDATQASPYISTISQFDNSTIPEEIKDQIRTKVVYSHPEYIEKFRPDLIENEEDRSNLWAAACNEYPNLITVLDTALIPDEDKRHILTKTIRENPTYIVEVDQSLIPDINERIDLWIAACKVRPSFRESELFPAKEINQNPAKLKELWITMFDTQYPNNTPRLNEIPKDLFSPEELRNLSRQVVEKDPSQSIYAPPSVISIEERTTAIKDIMDEDPWVLLNMQNNPTPPDLFTPKQIKELWDYALNAAMDEDSTADGYLSASQWMPYHLVDPKLLKNVVQHTAIHDYYENTSFLSKINYNLLEKLFSPEELFNLHNAVITDATCNGENGGPLAGIPLKYRTYEICKFALEQDPTGNVDVVAASAENFTDEEYQTLMDDAGNPNIDENFIPHIKEYTQENEEVQFQPLAFEGQQ